MKQTYQMEDNTRQPSVNCETESALHALQAQQAKVMHKSLLQTTQLLSSIIANHHVMLPLAIRCIGVEECKLRSVTENEAKVVIGVKVSME